MKKESLNDKITKYPILNEVRSSIHLKNLSDNSVKNYIVEPHFISGKNKEKLQNKKANGWRVMPYSTA